MRPWFRGRQEFARHGEGPISVAHEKEKSLSHAKKTLTNDKNITQVYNIISSLTDYSNETLNNDIIDMENHIKNNFLDNLAKVPIYFSIGKAYEDKKEYEKSFNNYFQANKLFNNYNKYDFGKDLEILKNLKVTFQKKEILSLRNTNNTNFNFNPLYRAFYVWIFRCC